MPISHSRINTNYLIGAAILLPVVVALSYGNISDHKFLHWDDISYIVDNKFLRSFSFNNLIHIFADFQSSNWHPVTWLSYAFNFTLFGESALSFKIFNLIIHLINSILVFYLAFLLLIVTNNSELKSIPSPANIADKQIVITSALAALLFAAHPQHVESVSWVSGRKDLLCTMFYMMAIISYIRMQYSKNYIIWTNIVSLSFVLALMSKTMAVTFPVLLMVLDIYPLRKTKFDSSLGNFLVSIFHKKYLYFVLSISVAVITFIAQTPNITDTHAYGVFARLSTSSNSFLYYIYSIFLPNLIAPYHPLSTSADYLEFKSILPIIFIASVFTASLYLFRKNYRGPLIIFLAYSILVLPMIGLVHVGHAASADRYAYLPTIIFYIVISLGLVKASQHFFGKNRFDWGIIVISLSLLVLLSNATYHYSKSWKNDETVWNTVAEKYPNTAAVAYSNLGNINVERQQYQSAISLYNRALEIDSKYLDALQNLGYIYQVLGNSEKAEKHYLRMIEVRPNSARAYTVVGDYFFKHSNFSKADYYYAKSLEIDPNSDQSLFMSSLLSFMKGDLKNANQKLGIFLKLYPGDLKGLQLKAKVTLDMGNYTEAEYLAKLILATTPEDGFTLDILHQIEKATEVNKPKRIN